MQKIPWKELKKLIEQHEQDGCAIGLVYTRSDYLFFEVRHPARGLMEDYGIWHTIDLDPTRSPEPRSSGHQGGGGFRNVTTDQAMRHPRQSDHELVH